jgi:quinoprotein glucose dehydrogenase
MIYIPSMTLPAVFKLGELDPEQTEYHYERSAMTFMSGPGGLPLIKPPLGRITAIDLNSGEHRWMVPNGEGPRQEMIAAGIPDPGPVGNPGYTHVLVTGSLLFTTLNDNGSPVLRALDKKTGQLVREVPLPASPNGAPMTYMAGGRQYISVAVGGATEAALVSLALDGKVQMRRKEMTAEDRLRRPDPIRVAQLYGQVCASCHDNAVQGAPRPGDRALWRPRLEAGLEKLYQSTISGIGDMPPRGGCSACTDGELMSLVDAMVEAVR